MNCTVVNTKEYKRPLVLETLITADLVLFSMNDRFNRVNRSFINKAIPGRMAMLITLLLVFINLFGQIIRNQPASRITLLSIWTLACTMFVTAALFAYGMLLWTKWRRPSDNKTIKVQTGSPLHPEDQNGSQTRETKEHVNGFTLGLIDKLIGTSNNWDRNCLILFPLVFLVFNLIYWPFVFAQHLAVEDSFNAT